MCRYRFGAGTGRAAGVAAPRTARTGVGAAGGVAYPAPPELATRAGAAGGSFIRLSYRTRESHPAQCVGKTTLSRCLTCASSDLAEACGRSTEWL